MSEENLWGELPIEEKIETPASILRMQGIALNKATKGMLDVRVVQGNWQSDLTYEFRIVAPVLGNYSATVLTIRHPMAMYPLGITSEALMRGNKTVSDLSEFKETLKEILQSETVRRTVSGLLAQSHDAGKATAPESRRASGMS